MKLYEKVEKAYTAATNTNFIDDRKSAFIPAAPFGLPGQVLVYHKAMLCQVHIGDSSIVNGYRVIQTIKNPQNKRDGFVVCR